MYGNQWQGLNDPSVVEGLKEIAEQIPGVDTAPLKNVLRGLGKITASLRDQLKDEAPLQANCETVTEC